MVTGGFCKSSIGENDFNEILDSFAPYGRNFGKVDLGEEQSSPNKDKEIDILIATDCVSEGQNLHDCDTVINYDIHWNPVRLIQRFGRIDRIGSQFSKIKCINYWPTKDLDAYLNYFGDRIEGKMALVDVTATGDDDLLNPSKVKEAAKHHRKRQLSLFKEGKLDPDNISEKEIGLQDFTLDDFIAQLLQYINNNQEQLQEASLGLYAVTDTSGKDTSRKKGTSRKEVPGIIFCFKKTVAADNKAGKANKQSGGEKANPLHPYILVYVSSQGKIHYDYTDIKNTLLSFSNLSIGKDSSNDKLCDRFDQDTKNGKDMHEQQSLLDIVMEKGIKEVYKKNDLGALKSGMSRGARLTPAKDLSGLSENHQLVSWLIVY